MCLYHPASTDIRFQAFWWRLHTRSVLFEPVVILEVMQRPITNDDFSKNAAEWLIESAYDIMLAQSLMWPGVQHGQLTDPEIQEQLEIAWSQPTEQRLESDPNTKLKNVVMDHWLPKFEKSIPSAGGTAVYQQIALQRLKDTEKSHLANQVAEQLQKIWLHIDSNPHELTEMTRKLWDMCSPATQPEKQATLLPTLWMRVIFQLFWIVKTQGTEFHSTVKNIDRLVDGINENAKNHLQHDRRIELLATLQLKTRNLRCKYYLSMEL